MTAMHYIDSKSAGSILASVCFLGLHKFFIWIGSHSISEWAAIASIAASFIAMGRTLYLWYHDRKK